MNSNLLATWVCLALVTVSCDKPTSPKPDVGQPTPPVANWFELLTVDDLHAALGGDATCDRSKQLPNSEDGSNLSGCLYEPSDLFEDYQVTEVVWSEGAAVLLRLSLSEPTTMADAEAVLNIADFARNRYAIPEADGSAQHVAAYRAPIRPKGDRDVAGVTLTDDPTDHDRVAAVTIHVGPRGAALMRHRPFTAFTMDDMFAAPRTLSAAEPVQGMVIRQSPTSTHYRIIDRERLVAHDQPSTRTPDAMSVKLLQAAKRGLDHKVGRKFQPVLHLAVDQTLSSESVSRLFLLAAEHDLRPVKLMGRYFADTAAPFSVFATPRVNEVSPLDPEAPAPRLRIRVDDRSIDVQVDRKLLGQSTQCRFSTCLTARVPPMRQRVAAMHEARDGGAPAAVDAAVKDVLSAYDWVRFYDLLRQAKATLPDVRDFELSVRADVPLAVAQMVIEVARHERLDSAVCREQLATGALAVACLAGGDEARVELFAEPKWRITLAPDPTIFDSGKDSK